MSFDRPWMILLAVLPLAWGAWAWRTALLNRRQRAGLILKVASFVCIVLALAQPRLSVVETKASVAVLVDTSASVSNEDLKKASSIVERLDNARGRHWMKVLPFARATRAADSREHVDGWQLLHTAGEHGRGSDIESAIRDASAALPESTVPRIVLISDGRENMGSVTRAAWQARELGIPVDVYPMAGRPLGSLRLEAVDVASTAFTGEKFPIELVVNSPKKALAELEILAEGKRLGVSTVSLQPGQNHVHAQASLTVSGAILLSGVLRAENQGEVRFAKAISLRRPRLRYVSQDPAAADAHLLKTLGAAQFDVTRTQTVDERALADTQILVMNNQDLENLPNSSKRAIELFVKQGGGLAIIGGDRNVYVEKKVGTPEDPLERAMPAKLSPPRSPEGTCVVLIVDKSSSMEGRKMELARLAAIGVIENLRPVDLVGVLIFDNSFQWAVPIRKAEDRTLIKRLVAGVTPDGGTQIAPALSEAFRRTLPVKATFKHIVLLTDGISEEGDSVTIAREAFQQKITISTVGLGQDVNRAYLERIANLSKGKPYFLNDPSGLEQILLRDVMEHTGSTAVEKPVVPTVVRQAQILDGIDIAKAPELRGYVKFRAKSSAETLLTVPGSSGDQTDPLLVRWQYGLGRAAIFSSDAKNRWAESWVSWAGFDRFWTNLLRDLLPHAEAGEVSIDFDPTTTDLVAEYRLGRNMTEPSAVPALYAFGPEGFQRPMTVQKIAAGVYRARTPIDDRQGLFRVRPLRETRVFPEAGYYRPERELGEYGADEELLKQVAAYTGGRVNPSPGQVFNSGGRGVSSTLALWPALLGIAILLTLSELLIRKWTGMPWAQPKPA